jgi:hypothetical protein
MLVPALRSAISAAWKVSALMGIMNATMLKFNEAGQVMGCRAESVPDAKICIKELKLIKKETALQKKEITARITQIRASHRSSRVASSAIKGKGFMAAMVKTGRSIEALSIDGQIRPFESQKPLSIETLPSLIRQS